MNRVHPREHPLFDRPFEFLLGVALATAGVMMLAGWALTGALEFAPNYLQASPVLAATTASLSVVGGTLTVYGLSSAYRGKTMRGRGYEAAGQMFMVMLTAGYAMRLLFFPDAPPPPRWTALIAILLSLAGAGLVRAFRLLQTNRRVTKALETVQETLGED